MTRVKRVAVIGAGLSGLAATKSCLEDGLEPVCFEQYDSIGGVWYYTEDYREGQGARAYTGLSTNVTKDMMAFSDFPFSADVSPYVTCANVYDYAIKYCKKFGLFKHIHLNTKILKISKSRDYDVTGKWELEIEEKGKGKSRQIFDFVMVCSGYNKKARIPDIEGMEKFKGSIEHAITFKDGTKYRNQRVLVVGNAHSAGDVSCAVSVFAEQVFVGIGKGKWILPKYDKRGVPFDRLLWRRANFWDTTKLNTIIMRLCNERFDHAQNGICPPAPPAQSGIMINDEIQNKMMTGMVKLVGDLVRLGPREAEFKDGTILSNLDAVIFATGYDLSLDFLKLNSPHGEEKLDLYKMTFPVRLPQNTLAVIGCLAAEGPFPPTVELQSRLASKVFVGKHRLPSREVMRDETWRMNELIVKRFGRYKYTVQNLPFRDELAAELGVGPSWWDLVKAGPRLAYLYYYGPAFPYYHRLWGPNAWFGARDAIENALKNGYCVKVSKKVSDPHQTQEQRFLLPVLLVSVATVGLFSIRGKIVSFFDKLSLQ